MKSRLTLIALFTLFFTPVLIAIFLHSEWVNWRAAPDKAHGKLVSPVIPLDEFTLREAGGSVRSLEDLLGRWQVIFIAPRRCLTDCLETAELMHNIRLAQDRHASEVNLILLSATDLGNAVFDRISALDHTWLVFDGDAGQNLMERLPDPAPGAFYIIDPEANIMERFAPDADLNGLRKDLDRLLTWTLRDPQ